MKESIVKIGVNDEQGPIKLDITIPVILGPGASISEALLKICETKNFHDITVKPQKDKK